MLHSPLRYCHKLLSEFVGLGDSVVDATVGNGQDTVKLAQLVGSTGKVYGFDIQKQAIEETKKKLVLTGLIEQVDLFQMGHENLSTVIAEQKDLSAVVFNLGYLPKGDKSITTESKTTLKGIEQSLYYLRRGGILLLMVYYGHPNGKTEKDAVLEYVSCLSQKKYNVLQYNFINQKNFPPFLLAVEKK